MIRRGQDRTCINQSLSDDIDLQVEPVERPCPQKCEVIGFGEHHYVGGRNPARMYDRVTDVPFDLCAVGHDESLPPFGLDSERFQYAARNPCKLAARVDERVGKFLNLTTLRGALDPDSRPENSHFRHFTPPRPVSPTNWKS
ncbi:MAG TPA: hypothetical protein VHE82_10510 [Gemmatimonadaceae bacterium]|nr:hypothetical protein [Gemmatimonadaceae bacterium]